MTVPLTVYVDGVRKEIGTCEVGEDGLIHATVTDPKYKPEPLNVSVQMGDDQPISAEIVPSTYVFSLGDKTLEDQVREVVEKKKFPRTKGSW